MTDHELGQEAAPPQTWERPPDGIYIPKIALVNWTRIDSPRLTISPDRIILEGYHSEPLGLPLASGYECVAEAVGWRWRFRAVVQIQTLIGLSPESRIPVVATSVGPFISESAPSGSGLQVR